MERGRRGSTVGSSDSRKRGKLQTVPEKMPAESSKFRGALVAPELQHTEQGLGIDPNLLVGPLYVPKTTNSDRIKEQLGDITEKLHKVKFIFKYIKENK